MNIRAVRREVPQPAPIRVLAWATVLNLLALHGFYRADLTQPGGPSPIMTLLVTIPAVPVFIAQRVRNAKPALLTALVAGVACSFGVAALLGFNEDWADYTGIAVGTLVFDLVFWARTRVSGRRGQVASDPS